MFFLRPCPSAPVLVARRHGQEAARSVQQEEEEEGKERKEGLGKEEGQEEEVDPSLHPSLRPNHYIPTCTITIIRDCCFI